MDNFLGIDIGTSGIRANIIDARGNLLARTGTAIPPSRTVNGLYTQQPEDWWAGILRCIDLLAGMHSLKDIRGIAIDGTSGTTLLTDRDNLPLSPALMYNDIRPAEVIETVKQLAPDIPACSRTSALARAIWLFRNHRPKGYVFVQQQADWILSRFTAKSVASDWNNALKLGFDVHTLSWPDWLGTVLPAKAQLPVVYKPGEPVARISASVAKATGLPPTAVMHAGTTDSIAAFLASGARQPGEAVTSLGTTLVLKLCTQNPVVSNQHGIYSHRLDTGRWLAGGASNSGGSVLKAKFSDSELAELSTQMDPDHDTGLDYYPLPAPGERFPIADPGFPPKIKPVPADRAMFLQGLFEGIARIEKQGYDLLEKLGADPVSSIRSAGGGANNPGFTRIRQRIVKRPLIGADNTDAAYGSALLAAGRV